MAYFFDALMFNRGEVQNRLDMCPGGQIITTTKGDLLHDIGGKTARLAVGSSGQLLSVNPFAQGFLAWTNKNNIASGVVSTVMSDVRPISCAGGPARYQTRTNTRLFTTLQDSQGGTQSVPSTDGIILVGSQIHVKKGKYFLIGFMPVSLDAHEHQTRLRNIDGTSQVDKVIVNSFPVERNNFTVYSRGGIHTVWYTINGTNTKSAMTSYYQVDDFLQIRVNVTSGDTTTQVATKTASAINNASSNLFPSTSTKIYFVASSTSNVITITHREVGPTYSPHAVTGIATWGYSVATIGTLTKDTNTCLGTSSVTNTGGSQNSDVTSNIFYELLINSSQVYEVQHNINGGTIDSHFLTPVSSLSLANTQELGFAAGLNNSEVYSNFIIQKMASV